MMQQFSSDKTRDMVACGAVAITIASSINLWGFDAGLLFLGFFIWFECILDEALKRILSTERVVDSEPITKEKSSLQ